MKCVQEKESTQDGTFKSLKRRQFRLQCSRNSPLGVKTLLRQIQYWKTILSFFCTFLTEHPKTVQIRFAFFRALFLHLHKSERFESKTSTTFILFSDSERIIVPDPAKYKGRRREDFAAVVYISQVGTFSVRKRHCRCGILGSTCVKKYGDAP